MTDRLAELRQGVSQSQYAVEDIENPPSPSASNSPDLARFTREADAIEKVHVWAERSVGTIENSLSDPDALPSVAGQLQTIESKLDAVRKRLKRIAAENKDMAADKSAAPATLRIRVTRYTQLGKRFMSVTSRIETVRASHRQLLADAYKKDILRANPAVTERQVDAAMQQGGNIDSVLMQVDNSATRHQIDDLRARNSDIQKLSQNIIELHQMFTDMSILVEGQQQLINDVEYNVKEVKDETKKANEELVIARRHQKSARKKKMCILILVLTILGVLAGGLVLYFGFSNNWWRDSNDNSSSSTTAPTTSAPSTTTASATNRRREAIPLSNPIMFKSPWYD